MDKQVCVITGSNSGIGKVTALQMAKQGYEVVMLVRNSEKSARAFEDIIRESRSLSVRMEYVDLSSVKSIMEVVEKIKSKYIQIDVLINNAGVYKRTYHVNEEGIEMTLAVNYLAPYIITTQLLPQLKKANGARIINVGSEMHKQGEALMGTDFGMQKFSGWKAYANSKLLLLYFTYELGLRLEGSGVTVNCVHPGFINTTIFRDYPDWLGQVVGWFIDTPEEGAEGTIFLATDDYVKDIQGKYFKKVKLKLKVTETLSDEVAKRVWKKSQALTQRMILALR